jgi:hypothetical protein
MSKVKSSNYLAISYYGLKYIDNKKCGCPLQAMHTKLDVIISDTCLKCFIRQNTFHFN